MIYYDNNMPAKAPRCTQKRRIAKVHIRMNIIVITIIIFASSLHIEIS